MKPQQLSDEVLNLLNKRLNDEYTAHYFYRNASNFLENLGLSKAATYYKKEAEDELLHAEGLQKYILGWNSIPTLLPLNSPMLFIDFVDVIEKAYILELSLLKSYNEDSTSIFTKDLSTFDFLEKYRTIQTQSVEECSNILNKLELINKSDKNWLFIFENEVF